MVLETLGLSLLAFGVLTASFLSATSNTVLHGRSFRPIVCGGELGKKTGIFLADRSGGRTACAAWTGAAARDWPVSTKDGLWQ